MCLMCATSQQGNGNFISPFETGGGTTAKMNCKWMFCHSVEVQADDFL